MAFGRDGLYEYMKKKYDKPPTKRVVLKWLSQQKLQQEFKQTRKGGTADFFHPVSPFHSISIDLIDYNNKPAQINRRYIVVCVDNFSRKMYCEAITSKEPKKTTPAMKKILDKIKSEHNAVPKYIITDDGGEFKGKFIPMLKAQGIDIRRTLGGHP